MLSKRYGITQRKNGRGVNHDPIELRRELLKEGSQFLRLQQFRRTTDGELPRTQKIPSKRLDSPDGRKWIQPMLQTFRESSMRLEIQLIIQRSAMKVAID
jgi:hypothetical protein